MSSYEKQTERIKRLDDLIRLKMTGTPDHLAGKLEVSRRQIFRVIDTMKELGFPIEYDKENARYYYDEEAACKNRPPILKF